jgi:hypothetical protein
MEKGGGGQRGMEAGYCRGPGPARAVAPQMTI